MIIRRIVLSLVLVLFGAVTIGVILGLDDAARSSLVSGLPATAVTAAPSEDPATSVSTTPATPTPATPTPASSASPSPLGPTAPKASPTTTTNATKKAAPRPKATAKPKPARPTPSARASARASKGGTVYLTFDDGPGPFTPQVLAILRRTGSTATFFQLGVNRPGHSAMIAAITAQGSNIGNHTYDHPDLTKQTAAQLRWQIAHGPQQKCFRPPYGATDAAVRTAAAKAGSREVLWTVDSLDWTKPGAAKLARLGSSKQIGSGSIVLMHDGGGDRTQTVAALPAIIADLHARGYRVRALPYC